MFNKRIESWMGILGFFGFLGFLGFAFNNVSWLIFFVFFGFFGFFLEGKLNKEKLDERLKKNFVKAQKYGYRAGMTMAFLALIVSLQIFESFKITLMIQTTLISLAIAVTMILIPMLTYYLDKEGLDDSE